MKKYFLFVWTFQLYYSSHHPCYILNTWHLLIPRFPLLVQSRNQFYLYEHTQWCSELMKHKQFLFWKKSQFDFWRKQKFGLSKIELCVELTDFRFYIVFYHFFHPLIFYVIVYTENRTRFALKVCSIFLKRQNVQITLLLQSTLFIINTICC